MITVNLDNFDALMLTMNPSIVKKAVRTAITKTSRKLRTAISKETRDRYNVALFSFKDNVKVRLANTPDGIVLKYVGSRLDPYDLKGTRRMWVTPNSNHKRVNKRSSGRVYESLKMKVLKEGRVKRVKGKYGFGAFHGTGQTSGAKLVFERMTKKRLKIKRVTATAIPQMVGHEEVRSEVGEQIKGELNYQFKDAMRYHLHKAAGIIK